MQDVTYISESDEGHRAEYTRLLTGELAREGIRLNRVIAARLAGNKNDPLFYSMIESIPFDFLIRAAARSLSGQKTVGLLFRPNECFGGALKHRIKYILFRAVSGLAHVRVLTLIPFSVFPRLPEVATGWIYDPQLWDLGFLGMPEVNAFAELDRQIRDAARGRRMVIALGNQNREKGFDLLADIWSASPDIRKAFLFVIAGKVLPSSRQKAERFVSEGGLLFDRRIEDGEFLHFYRHAHAVWSCYAPDYNQASGIYGRAVQLGVPVAIRAGSYLDSMGPALSHPALALPFDAPDASAEKLLAWQPSAVDPVRRDALVQDMRAHSLSVLADALKN